MEHDISKSDLYGEFTRLDRLASRAEHATSAKSCLHALNYVNECVKRIKKAACHTLLSEDTEVLDKAIKRRQVCLNNILGKFPELETQN